MSWFFLTKESWHNRIRLVKAGQVWLCQGFFPRTTKHIYICVYLEVLTWSSSGIPVGVNSSSSIESWVRWANTFVSPHQFGNETNSLGGSDASTSNPNPRLRWNFGNPICESFHDGLHSSRCRFFEGHTKEDSGFRERNLRNLGRGVRGTLQDRQNAVFFQRFHGVNMADTRKKERLEEKDLPGYHRSRQKRMDMGRQMSRYEDSVLRERDLRAYDDLVSDVGSDSEPSPEFKMKLKMLLSGDWTYILGSSWDASSMVEQRTFNP